MKKIPNVAVKVDRAGAIVSSLVSLAAERVLVGYPDSAAGRRDGEISNAALAYIHDTGDPAANLPARPFLAAGVREGRDRFLPYLVAAGEAAADGDEAGVRAALSAAGLSAQASVRAKITDGPFAPLKPETIAARRRSHRGRKADVAADVRPLIDTAQLRNGLTYVLRNVTFDDRGLIGAALGRLARA